MCNPMITFDHFSIPTIRSARPLTCGTWSAPSSSECWRRPHFAKFKSSSQAGSVSFQTQVLDKIQSNVQVVYPNTWSAAEFRQGVAAAFEHVNRISAWFAHLFHSFSIKRCFFFSCSGLGVSGDPLTVTAAAWAGLLDEGDFLSLRQLMDDPLLEDLRKSHTDLTKGLAAWIQMVSFRSFCTFFAHGNDLKRKEDKEGCTGLLEHAGTINCCRESTRVSLVQVSRQ